MKKTNRTKANGNRKPIIFGILIIFGFLTFIPSAAAHCPLCTGATIVGISVTRALGLNDSIIGVFTGGMIISTALWFDKILKKKGFKGNNQLRLISLILLTGILTLITFYYAGLFGRGNSYRMMGVENILVGLFSGVIVSLAAFYYSNHLKAKNEGKVLFSYQTIVLSLGGLIINAALFALIF